MRRDRCVAGLLLAASAILMPARGQEACRPLPPGIRRIEQNGSLRTESTARVRVRTQDDEGWRSAEAEAEMKAKAQLAGRSAKNGSATLAGAIVRETCRNGGYIYITVETGNALGAAGSRLKSQTEKSIKRTPAPR
jgi:hypothetical protein